jgi:phosphoglycolate phosphatase
LTANLNLLFDIDGTLTDPRQGILACFRHALDALGVKAPWDQELERFIGPPLRESFSAVLRDPALVEQAVALYRERFAAKGMFENRVYPGIHGALEHLHRSGCRLFVATAKPGVFAERILEYFELRPFFSGVYGSEPDGRNGNKADLLAGLLKAESLLRGGTIMIGDRAHDVLGAKANGIFAVGVLWGFGSRKELAEAGADLLCETPGDLTENLDAGKF